VRKRRVWIVGDRTRPGVAEGVAKHRAFLDGRLDVLGVDLDGTADLATAKADLVLVFGGDGSILRAARRLGANPVPVLGVNHGQFGFLADLEPEEVEPGIERWLRGEHTTTRRLRLRARLVREGKVLEEWLALNDVVVGRSDVGRMVDVDVAIDGSPAISFGGDGLIVATPTGSTAHALAAGGPIVEPAVDAVLLVPVACFALSARPLAVRASHRLELGVATSRSPGVVTVDGSPPRRMERHDVVEVSDAGAPFTLVHASGRSFFDALRTKLGWSGRPEYSRVRHGAGPSR
jgi:NAD+ kinase